MSELKKLFRVKRILAMALAIAMMVTSIPVTAQAAAPDEMQTVADANTDDVSTDSDVETGEEETQPPAETAEDTEDDVQLSEVQPDADQTDGVDAAVEQPTTGDDSAQQQEESGADATVEQPTAVELGESKFEGAAERVFSYTKDGTSPVADETGKKLSTDFLSSYSIIANGSYKSLNMVEDPVVSTITYQWFAGDSALGDAKKLAEEGTFPIDAGSYTLKLVLPAKENEYKGAEAAFSFEITKPEVTVTVDTLLDPVPVGTKWSEVALPSITSVDADNGKNFTYIIDDKSTEVNEAANNEVAFTMVIKDAATGVVLSGEQTLVKNGEYVISIVPEFIGANKDKYDKNYTWKHCDELKLPIGELKATRLTLTPDSLYEAKAATVANDDDERTVQIIEAASFTKEIQELKYTSVLEAEDGKDEQNKQKWKTIEGQTVGEWYTAASYSGPWAEGDTTYCSLTLGGKLDEAPTIPGTYVYRVSYEGDQKEYNASYADIVVVVAVAEIIVRPKVPEKVTFYDGQTVKSVLSQIDYDLPYADGRTESGKEVLYSKTPDMWGTSYDDDKKTQPYKPDFELVEIVKDKDGKETKRNTYTSSSSSVLKLGNDYIVRFTGEKHVYNELGVPQSRVDINAAVDSMDPATCGYKVKTDQGTLEAEANTCKLELAAKDKAIDVTEIEKAATDKAKMSLENVGALEGAFTKTYDGVRLFELNADYKKAKLVSGSSDPNKDFRYTWQMSEYTYAQLLATHKEEEKDVLDVSKEDLENGDWYSLTDGLSLVNGGIYRLHVTYNNSHTYGFADPADVYFVIKPQEITLTFNKESLVGNVGNYANEFSNNHAKELNEGTGIIPSMEQPTKAEDWKNEGLLTEAAEYAYWVRWAFYQKAKETNAEGQQVDKLGPDGKPEMVPYTDSLQLDGEYFLGVQDFEMGSYDPEDNGWEDTEIFNRNFVVKKDIYVPVTVKAMGAGEIVFDGITTVDGKVIEKTKTYDAESLYALIKDDLAKLNAPVVIKTDAAGAETKEAVTFAEGEYGLTYVVRNETTEAEKTYATLPTDEAEWDWTKNAGAYTIYVSFGGNERYAELFDTLLATITVDQKELIFVVPELTEEFTAGQTVDNVLSAAWNAFFQQDVASVKAVEGEIPEADKKYFTKTEVNGQVGFLAWYYDDGDSSGFGMPSVYVHDNVSGEDHYWDDTILQGAGDQRYSLCGKEYNYLEGICAVNYTISAVEPAKGTPIKVVRGASVVEMEEYNGKKLDIKDSTDIPKDDTGSVVKEHTVTIKDGITYHNSSPSDENEGNIVKIRIEAPAEYAGDSSFNWNKVIYEQSIKNAAGERLIGSFTTGYRTLEFTYDATVGDKEDKEDLVFSIRWEEDYNERFIVKFSEAELLGNLKDAVAPKSLAFNAPRTTMTVGQEQELDVKIKKVQNADIICLGYEVTSGKEYMHVDEFGKVTALKEGGKATVEVYPMHVVDGKKVRIEGSKSAKTTITVKKVSAPKIVKVTPKDTSLIVEYIPPVENDGYRREIYVVEGKNVKADVIEKKITEEMKNEQWQGIFVQAPKFFSPSEESSSQVGGYKKTNAKAAVLSIGGLDLQKDYTVYVRNVSAVRSFADGCQVSLSAAGTAKSCKTTLKQVSDITSKLNGEQIVSIYTGDDEEGYLKKYVDDVPTEEEIRDASEIGYEIPLEKRNVQISLEGLFKDVAGDGLYIPIPFLKSEAAALKKSYAEPKMAYYFWDYIYDGRDAYYGTSVIERHGYTTTSSVAAIDKKGKITLKQPGTVIICAVDTVSGRWANSVKIHVTAEADSMKAKNATMQVGQRIRLEKLVEYKQGRTVLNQDNYGTYGRIDVKEAQASLRSAGKESSFGISDGGYLTAYAKDSLNLTLKDTVLNTSVTVKITAKDLAPVKGLKAVNVIDKRFDVQFEMSQYAEAYRIEILDAKRTIRSIYVENIPFSGDGNNAISENGWYCSKNDSWEDDDWGDYEWINKPSPDADWNHDSEHFVRNDGLCRADKIKGKWILTYRIDRLTQTSKYNIQVTALFGEVKSKVAKKAVTTTKLPACDSVLSGKIEPGKNDYNDGLGLSRTSFVSGNTYSVEVIGNAGRSGTGVALNDMARIAGTDTLTWSSSNKKVATVKAMPGGYSATLKALKDGDTVIELKSKVLKGVVARVSVHVRTVGDAYKTSDYYGDNEDLRGEGSGKTNLVTELTVGVAEPVELSAGQSKTFKVTLTEEGVYTAYKVVNGEKRYWDDSSKSGKNPDTWTIGTIWGSFTGSVIVEKTGNVNADDFKNRTVLKLNEAAQLQEGAWYVFTAPNDGLYGFKNGGYSSKSIFEVHKQSTDKDAGKYNPSSENPEYFYELKKGEVVYLKANGSYSSVQVVEAKFDTLAVGSSVTVSRGNEKWFEFTPAEMDEYEFELSNYSDVEFFDEKFESKHLDSRYDNPIWIYYGLLNSKIYIRVPANYNDVTLQVSKKNAVQKFGEDGSYTLSEHTFSRYNDYLYVNYKAPADGFYTFSYEALESGISGYANLYSSDKLGSAPIRNGLYITSNGTSKFERVYLSKDEEVVLRVQTNNVPATWTNVKFVVAKVGEVKTATTEAAVNLTEEENWISFTAGADGYYGFGVTSKAGNARSTMYAYKDPTSQEGQADISGGKLLKAALSQGETIWLKVGADALTDATNADQLTVKKLGAIATSEISLVDPGDGTGYVAVAKFIPSKKGFYKFSCNNNEITSMNLYKDRLLLTSFDSNILLQKDAHSCVQYLSEEETVYLKLSAGSAVSAVSVEINEIVPELLEHVNVQQGEFQWIQFTAPSAGNYTFYSTNNSGDSYAWFSTNKFDADNVSAGDLLTELDDNADYTSDDEGGSGPWIVGDANFAKKVLLSEGETIYLAVGRYHLNGSMSCDVYVLAQ